MPNRKKQLIILTSGGDAPGMNPALRAAVRCWLHKNASDKGEKNSYIVIAAKNGYNGIINWDVSERVKTSGVGGLLARGGTVIGAGRCENLKEGGSFERSYIKEKLDSIRNDLAGLIVIGGDGSFRGMKEILLDECQVRTIGIPATIDNDIWGTDLSLGVDTALNTNVELIDKIRDTAAAFRRSFVVEIMGRNCGYLALATAIATESEALFLPEDETSFPRLGRIKRNLDDLFEHKILDTVVIVAEGAKLKLPTIENILQTYTKWEIRSVVPGYTQRGGSPSGIDRILGCRFAWKAVKGLKEPLKGPYAKVVTLRGINIELDNNLDNIIKNSGKNSKIEDDNYRKMKNLQWDLSSYCTPLGNNIGNSLLVIHGPDAPGINAAIRAYTRIAMKMKIGAKFTGFRTIAVRRGLEGLADLFLQDNDFIELDWEKTTGFSYTGGVPSNLSQLYNIEPIHAGPRDWLKKK
ncbi:MAG: 6-phosphofructokinase 1, partial [Acidobacteriota bacterium]|nr:6-phosphofructokinase 1 [Acidobacteriota bacterium]